MFRTGVAVLEIMSSEVRENIVLRDHHSTSFDGKIRAGLPSPNKLYHHQKRKPMGCGISTAAGGLPDTVTPPAPQAPTAAAIWLRFLRLENVPDSDASPFSHGDFHMNACLASEKFRTPCTYVGQSKYGLPQFQTVSARESVTWDTMAVFPLPANNPWQNLDQATLTCRVFDKDVVEGDDFIGQMQVSGAELRRHGNTEEIVKVELKLAPEFRTENGKKCILSFRVYDYVMGEVLNALDSFFEASVALAGELSIISDLLLIWEHFFANLFPYEGDRPRIECVATIGGRKFITALTSLGEHSSLYPSSMAPTRNALDAVKLMVLYSSAAAPSTPLLRVGGEVLTAGDLRVRLEAILAVELGEDQFKWRKPKQKLAIIGGAQLAVEVSKQVTEAREAAATKPSMLSPWQLVMISHQETWNENLLDNWRLVQLEAMGETALTEAEGREETERILEIQQEASNRGGGQVIEPEAMGETRREAEAEVEARADTQTIGTPPIAENVASIVEACKWRRGDRGGDTNDTRADDRGGHRGGGGGERGGERGGGGGGGGGGGALQAAASNLYCFLDREGYTYTCVGGKTAYLLLEPPRKLNLISIYEAVALKIKREFPGEKIGLLCTSAWMEQVHIGYTEALKKHGLELVKALPPRIQDKCMQGITLVKTLVRNPTERAESARKAVDCFIECVLWYLSQGASVMAVACGEIGCVLNESVVRSDVRVAGRTAHVVEAEAALAQSVAHTLMHDEEGEDEEEEND